GIGGCLGENCVRPTPSLSMDIGFAIFPRSFVAIIPTFSFALLGTDYSPPEKGYAYTSGTLIMPGVRVEVRHKVNKAMVVSVYSGAGMAWYSKTGVQENMVSDTIKSDFGSFVQLGFGVKYHLFVLELMAGIGGRLHTWADQEGPLASYYIHLGFAVKFVGF
ncbi:hypothetical protein KJ865_15640, partial [Myxococcota bacterium]|nr:hypothetical protein [Myxococcota bacterium]